MFKHILAAIDGSEHSTKAAKVAIELARTYGSDLTLLHVTRKLDLPDQLKEYLKADPERRWPVRRTRFAGGAGGIDCIRSQLRGA